MSNDVKKQEYQELIQFIAKYNTKLRPCVGYLHRNGYRSVSHLALLHENGEAFLLSVILSDFVNDDQATALCKAAYDYLQNKKQSKKESSPPPLPSHNPPPRNSNSNSSQQIKKETTSPSQLIKTEANKSQTPNQPTGKQPTLFFPPLVDVGVCTA